MTSPIGEIASRNRLLKTSLMPCFSPPPPQSSSRPSTALGDSHSSSRTTMSSLRHHRIIIASLFLPNTTVLGDSAPSSPDESPSHSLASSTPALLNSTTPARGSLLARPPGPLRSIVEDLRDKVRFNSLIVSCILLATTRGKATGAGTRSIRPQPVGT